MVDGQRAQALGEADLDPKDFLRALLKISPEYAEKARVEAAKQADRGSHATLGED